MTFRSEFDSIAWLRVLADHTEKHNLNHTISAVAGYYPRIHISATHCLTDLTYPVFTQWANSIDAATVRAMVVDDQIHVTTTGTLGTFTIEIVAVLVGDEAEQFRASREFPNGTATIHLAGTEAVL
ncbi:hypothetical protein [Kutzneria albida]|uniref:Uncharacterized protein n=1 Tax=Kutzneria albida DSM 43870 TaxID=1449976 RepID=W5WAU9_9PSEU|nr:hypothetical protein [Kutzneria albida]AHH98253.1 hypothetical protein KALB_4891 [Kutzneria albida DSM 43870]